MPPMSDTVASVCSLTILRTPWFTTETIYYYEIHNQRYVRFMPVLTMSNTAAQEIFTL